MNSDEMRKKGYLKKNFIEAKYDFVDKMMEFGQVGVVNKPAKVLDVGCGIGGTSRWGKSLPFRQLLVHVTAYLHVDIWRRNSGNPLK